MNKFNSKLSTQFIELINILKGKNVAILGHRRPDGDCIGSQVALCRALNQIGVESVAINHDAIPQSLKSFIGDTPWICSGKNDITDYLDYKVITADCADEMRAGEKLHKSYNNVLINIDHHISNTNYATHNFVVSDASATAEILAVMFLDNNLPIDSITAQALYIGIATDTGQFRYNSTTKQVFEICCKLIQLGANPAEAALQLYENESVNKIKLLQKFLSTLKFEFNKKVCIGQLNSRDYTESDATYDDSEGLVDYARSIKGVEIGILLEERKGSTKGSLRSKDPVHRVDLLASKFNGGGHACAAGFNIDENIEKVYELIISNLTNHFKYLNL